MAEREGGGDVKDPSGTPRDATRRRAGRRDPRDNTEFADEPGLLDEVADRLGFRGRIKANPALGLLYRIGVGVLGVAVIAVGVILLPLPGPGWLIIFLGLGILATEFAWAERLLDYAKSKVLAWTHWVTRQSLVVKFVISLGCLAIIAGVVGGYVAWMGVPSWLPFVD